MTIEKRELINMYRVMVRIRKFEERTRKEFAAGNIPGFVHLYAGEEAIATGACANLRPDDYKTNLMMAELYGKKTGYCKGKGGSMHIADVDIGILGANGIVGAGIPIAGGAALSAKMRGTKQVAICFCGDGATNTTRFHEGVNLASIWKLPIVYVIENNMYAQKTPISYAANIPNIADRASAYGIPGETVDGNDVLAVYEAVGEAVARARRGEGPTLVECKTYRYHGHNEGDEQTYRTKEEVEGWMKEDPIPRFKEKLIGTRVLTEKEANEIDQAMLKELDEAVKFAEGSPFPDPEEALEDVFA